VLPESGLLLLLAPVCSVYRHSCYERDPEVLLVRERGLYPAELSQWAGQRHRFVGRALRKPGPARSHAHYRSRSRARRNLLRNDRSLPRLSLLL